MEAHEPPKILNTVTNTVTESFRLLMIKIYTGLVGLSYSVVSDSLRPHGL